MRVKLSKSEKQEIKRLHRAGYTIKQLQISFGVPRVIIVRVIWRDRIRCRVGVKWDSDRRKRQTAAIRLSAAKRKAQFDRTMREAIERLNHASR